LSNDNEQNASGFPGEKRVLLPRIHRKTEEKRQKAQKPIDRAFSRVYHQTTFNEGGRSMLFAFSYYYYAAAMDGKARQV